jgi:hypothetical protein
MLLGVKKVKIGPQSPKTEFVLQNLYCCVISDIDRKFYTKQEKIYFWGSKSAKISLQGTNMDLGPQNQYGRVQGRTGQRGLFHKWIE